MLAPGQKALYNLIVSADLMGEFDRMRVWMAELKRSLAERPEPNIEISVGIADALWLSYECRHVTALRELERLRPRTQQYGTQNQQIFLELVLAEVALRAGESLRASAALARADGFVQLRRFSQYRWRILRLKAEMDMITERRTECRARLRDGLADLPLCEDLNERILITRLAALTGEGDARDRYLEQSRELCARNRDTQIVHGQAAFEAELAAEAGRPAESLPAPLANIARLSRFEAIRLELAQGRLAWDLGRYAEARRITEGILVPSKELVAAEAPIECGLALGLKAAAEIGLGDWSELWRTHRRAVKELGTSGDPALTRVNALLAVTCVAIGLTSTEELLFLEGLRRLRSDYASADPALRGLIARVTAALGTSLQIEAARNLAELLFAERSHLVIFQKQLKAMTRDGQLVNFAAKPLLYEILKLFCFSPQKKWTKEEIAEKIWNEPYNPLRHDQLIYVNIGRLKKLIEPEKFEDSVVVNLDFSYALHPGAVVRLL